MSWVRFRSGPRQFDTNVFGLIGFPGSGYYVASKHAVEGRADSLRAELLPLGIGVTCVEPGPFRTDWAGRSLRQTANRITDYAETAGKRLLGTKETSGAQAGDPVKAAAAMIAIARGVDAPQHLVLGAWGFNMVVAWMQERMRDIVDQRESSSLPRRSNPPIDSMGTGAVVFTR